MRAPSFDGSFVHTWKAEMLESRPYILPAHHYTYPATADEAEHGALEVLVHPDKGQETFLATCVLGFKDPGLPSGIWSCPNPVELCALSGGYAYILNTTAPARFTMLPYRPVLEVRALVEQKLLIFSGHHSLLAWGLHGEAWETERLSWEGVTISSVEDGKLHGIGWDMIADKDVPFAIDLKTGQKV